MQSAFPGGVKKPGGQAVLRHRQSTLSAGTNRAFRTVGLMVDHMGNFRHAFFFLVVWCGWGYQCSGVSTLARARSKYTGARRTCSRGKLFPGV